MKRTFLSAALLLGATMSFAQVKLVKEAKNLAKDSKFAEATAKIREAKKNAETANDPQTYDVSGMIQHGIYQKENIKISLKQQADTAAWANSVYNTFVDYFKCDELAQVPNEKGKIKNKFRKKNSQILAGLRPILANIGVTYYNEQKLKEAVNFFGMYVESAKNPIFTDDATVQNDTLVPVYAYYAAVAATNVKDYPAVVKYAAQANNKEFGQPAAELMAQAYKAEGDTVAWVNCLKEGLKKYPADQYLFGNLVDYYMQKGQYDTALSETENMVALNGESAHYAFVKGIIYRQMNEYKKAFDAYEKAISLDPKDPKLYSEAGLTFLLEARDYQENATTDINSAQYEKDKKYLDSLYEKAKPYYEKARELAPDEQSLWLNGLYTIYYNLKDGEKFKEIEELM